MQARGFDLIYDDMACGSLLKIFSSVLFMVVFIEVQI